MTTTTETTKHRKNVRDFQYHLMTYVFVSVLLVAIDLRAVTSGQPIFGLDFAFWVIFGWGFGVAGHAITVFFGDDRADRQSD